jgi:putative endonuclease
MNAPALTKDAIGRHGEDLAAAHLRTVGLSILDRNWRCPAGELDIVARERGAVVFVEVKTRSSDAFGDPAEAIDAAKAARLRRVALHWLAAHPASIPRGATMRFDVVSIVRTAAGRSRLRHLRGAL